MSPIKVLIVDDHAIVREGLKALLDLENDIRVTGEASSSLECMDTLEKCLPEIILMDIKMPGISGIEATRLIKNSYPGIKVILLTNYEDEEYILEAIKVGADGYVIKDIKKGELTRIIHNVMEGRSFIDPAVTRKALNQLKQIIFKGEGPLHPILSERELQILEHVVEGKTNKEIAEVIHLSIDTVKSHLKKTYQKLGIHTRSQAIKTAIKEGIVNFSR